MKAVILDMYGVILKDPGEGFYTYVSQTFPDLTPADIYPIWDRADIGEITSLEVLERLGYTGDLEAIEKTYLDTVEIDEGFYEFAKRIKKTCKLALLSNDSSEWSAYFREKFDINQYFDVITVSGDVKMKKPNPEIYRLTLEKLGLAAEDCVYVDDRRYNLSAAEAVGMKTVLFNSRRVEYDGEAVESFVELMELLERRQGHFCACTS